MSAGPVRWRVRDRPFAPGVVRAVLVRPRLRRIIAGRVLSFPPESRVRRFGLDVATRAASDAFNRGDTTMALSFHTPDAELRTPLAALDMEDLHGPAGVRRTWELWTELWADTRRDVHEVVDCGHSTLFLCTHVSRGRDGLEVRQPLGLIYRWEDCRVVRQEEYFDHEESLRALTLPT